MKMKDLLIFAPAPLIMYLVFSQAFTNDLIKTEVLKYIPCCEWTFENKITLIVNMSVLIALYTFTVIMCTALSRFFYAPHPLENKDPQITELLNQILRNTVEQTIIFLPLLACWTINRVNNEEKHKVVILTLVWLLGRVLFTFGYSMKLVHPKLSTFRSYGFVLNIASIVYLISRLLNHPIF